MKKDKAIKDLFSLQDISKKVEIINENALTIKGFDNINYKTLKVNENIIINRINTIPNIKKIDKLISQYRKQDEDEFDYLLSADKIVEKYGTNFEKLLLIFNYDGYGELTETVLLKLKEEHIDKVEKVEVESERVDDIVSLRDIIRTLEKKVETRDAKIIELNEKIKTYNNEITEYKKLKTKSETELKRMKEEYNQSLKSINEKDDNVSELNKTIQDLKSKEESLLIEFDEYKNNNKERINILGIPKGWKINDKNYLKYYDRNELNNFINDFNESIDEKFYVYKQGITVYDFREIIKSIKVTIINSKDEFLKIIKEV